MNTSFHLIFYLKKPKGYVKGNVPIYLRITVEGQRSEASTSRECDPNKWNSAAGRASGTKEDVKALNTYLDTIQTKIYEAHRLILSSGDIITAESIKNKYFGKEEKTLSLVSIFEDHNNKMETLLGSEYALNTIKRYKTSLKHTKDFLKWKYNISDIDIRKINNAFITEYEFYLRSVCKCANNSAVKYIRNFAKIIRICLANEWIEKNPFANYKSKLTEVIRAFLNEDELQTITNKVFATERLNQVRDIFLFSCYTGLAYADVKKLDRMQIVIGIDGEQWIHTKRQKTDTLSHIPILPFAMSLIDKYKNHPQCVNQNRLLPVLSNQKMNSYLKEIADCCGINKDLTFHIARHTFATTVTLTNGVSIESVSKMLGHKSIRTTQHYAKIIDKKVSEDMKSLREKLSLSNNNDHIVKMQII